RGLSPRLLAGRPLADLRRLGRHGARLGPGDGPADGGVRLGHRPRPLPGGVARRPDRRGGRGGPFRRRVGPGRGTAFIRGRWSCAFSAATKLRSCLWPFPRIVLPWRRVIRTGQPFSGAWNRACSGTDGNFSRGRLWLSGFPPADRESLSDTPRASFNWRLHV